MIWLGYSLSTDPKHDGKQNYLCRDCNRQFVGDHNLTYPGCHSGIDRTILKMLVRNCGIRDISEITGCSRYKVQKVLKISQHHALPKKNHYDSLEVDELWTFVGSKKNKVWLIYAYDRSGGKIVAYAWGKRDITTVRELEARLNALKLLMGILRWINGRVLLKYLVVKNRILARNILRVIIAV